MTYADKRLLILQHLPHEGAGSILDWAVERGHETATMLVPSNKEPFPLPDSFDVLLILGGIMAVYEEEYYAWMKAEKAFIKSAVEANKTVIGICLGSQLLAEALGAKVYPHTEKEIGFFPVYKTEAGRGEEAIAVVPNEWWVFHWHGDTFDLPQGAMHLFRSSACANQAFRKGKCWGFQFHPEINEDLLDGMITFEPDELTGKNFVQTADKIRDAFLHYNQSAFHQVLDDILDP